MKTKMKSLNLLMNVIVIITSIQTALGQNIPDIENNLKAMQYKAYLNKDITLWEKALAITEKNFNSNPEDLYLLTELAETQYGLLYSCIANNDENTFIKYVDATEKNIRKLLEYNKKDSYAHALIAGLYSAKMAFAPWKGMFLGPKSNKHIQKALQYDKKSGIAWTREASSKYHTPEMFGGDITESIKCFDKAIELFEQDTVNLKYNWEYINALAWLGQAYQKLDKKEKAIAVFEKALVIEPEFSWVKYYLLPKVKETSNN